MSLHLITGYAGREHITAADQGAYNIATFGKGQFVLNRGNKFSATILTNNSIKISDGEAMMQGRFIKMPTGTDETVSIDNGTQGMKRYDLICIRYSKSASDSVESASLVVIKGTPNATTPTDPSYTVGTITDSDDTVNDMPLYRVSLDGINIASVTSLFSVKTSMVEYMDDYQLLPATASRLGGVKVGSGLNVSSDGVISLPTGKSGTTGDTGSSSPSFGGSFTVPYISTNAYGQVTGGGTRSITLPSAPSYTQKEWISITIDADLYTDVKIPTSLSFKHINIKIDDYKYRTLWAKAIIPIGITLWNQKVGFDREPIGDASVISCSVYTTGDGNKIISAETLVDSIESKTAKSARLELLYFTYE